MIMKKRQFTSASNVPSKNIPVRVKGYMDYAYGGKTSRAIRGVNEVTGEEGVFVQYEQRAREQEQGAQARSFERPSHDDLEKGYTAGTSRHRVGPEDMLVARSARQVGETEVDGQKLPVYRYEWPNVMVYTSVVENRTRAGVQEIVLPNQDDDCIHRGIAMMSLSRGRDAADPVRAYADLLRFDDVRTASAAEIEDVVRSFIKEQGNQSFLVRSINGEGQVTGAIPPISRTWKVDQASGSASRLPPEESAKSIADQVMREIPDAEKYEIVPGERFHVSRMSLSPDNARNRIKYYESVANLFSVDMGEAVERVAREVILKTGMGERSQNTINHFFVLSPGDEGLDPALVGKNGQILHYSPECVAAQESIKASASTSRVQTAALASRAPVSDEVHMPAQAIMEDAPSFDRQDATILEDDNPFAFVDDGIDADPRA